MRLNSKVYVLEKVPPYHELSRFLATRSDVKDDAIDGH